LRYCTLFYRTTWKEIYKWSIHFMYVIGVVWNNGKKKGIHLVYQTHDLQKYTKIPIKFSLINQLAVRKNAENTHSNFLANSHVRYTRLLFNLIFTSGHAFCWLCSQNVSLLPEDGPLKAETCRSVTVWIVVLQYISALVGFLRKIVTSLHWYK